jgi:hypothetical protein
MPDSTRQVHTGAEAATAVVYLLACCGALAHLQVVKRQDPAALCACLKLLTAACSNAANLERLCTEHCQALVVALDLVVASSSISSNNISITNCTNRTDDSSAASASSAAAQLVYAASISPATRPVIAQQLVAKVGRGGYSSRLEGLWRVACEGGAAAQQVGMLGVQVGRWACPSALQQGGRSQSK